MPKKPDVMIIEDELASRAEKLKWDKKAIATCPGLHECLSQYVKDRGNEQRWCPDCYITKKPEDRSNPYLVKLLPLGKNALYKCGKCGLEIEALR